MGQASAATVGPFIGRDRELPKIDQAITTTTTGGSSALAFVGESGIGKSRLLGELKARAEGASCRVLAGRGSELEPDTPFGLFIEAMDDALGELDPVALKRLGDERAAELAAMFPSLAGRSDKTASCLDVERHRCHYAIRSVLKYMVQERPLTLLLDDIHWADPASLELISFLLRRAVPGVLLVLAYRPPVSPELAMLASHAVRERTLRLINLGPLSYDEAATLLHGQLVRPSLEALYVETGGNPFYLEQLVRAPKQRAKGVLPPGARWAEDNGGSVPGPVRTTMEQALATLSAAARLLAQGAAVAGDPFDVDLSRRIAEVDEPTAWAAVDELVAAGIARPTDVPGRIAFWHPITRRAIYNVAGHGWRVGAHRRAAAELAARAAPLPAQAHHVMRSAAEVGDREAISLLVEAAQATAPRAPAAAAQWLQCAVRLMTDEAPIECRLRSLDDLAATFATLGRIQDSYSTLCQALMLLPADRVDEAARLTALLARSEFRLGRRDEAHHRLSVALTGSSADTGETPELQLELARIHDGAKDWNEAVQVSGAALELTREHGHAELGIAASVMLAFCASNVLGAVEDGAIDDVRATARQNLDAAASSIDGLSDDDMSPRLMDALVLLISAELLNERWESAERHAQRGVRVCRATGLGRHFLELMVRLVQARVRQGRLSDAREAAEVVAEAMHVVENDELLVFSEVVRCWVASLQGQTGIALAAGSHAVDVANQNPKVPGVWRAQTYYGEALIEAGQHTQGQEVMLTGVGPNLDQVVPSARSRCYRFLTEAAVAEGNIELARDLAQRARAVADQIRLPTRMGDALYAEANVSLVEGDLDGARRAASASAAAYEEANVPLESARARMLTGIVSAQAGDDAEALSQLAAAYDAFEQRDATRLADRAAKELRRLGHRVSRKSQPPRGGSGSGLGLLSEREREVAALVSQGRTTRQVAKDLYVSPKTIETHLAHIYAKLGVSSRTAMVAALAPSHERDER